MSSNSDRTSRPGGRAAHTSPGRAPAQLAELLSRGEAAARAGWRSEARRLFREALELDPTNEDAWLWLGFLAPSARQSLDYLQHALNYHPHSDRVRQAIAWAQERLEPSERIKPVPRAAASRAGGRAAPLPAAEYEPATLSPAETAHRIRQPGVRRLSAAPAVTGLALVVVALVAVVVAYLARHSLAPAFPSRTPANRALAALPADMATLRLLASEAVSNQDWERTIPLLERMRELSPHDDGVRQQLAVAHLRYGLQLVEQDRLDEAIDHYDAAIRFYANDVDLQVARRLAVGYRDGRRACEKEQWAEAVELLRPVHRVAPDFRDVADLLFTAYIHRAASLEVEGKREAARQAYAGALVIRPGASEAQARLAEITATLIPPTPSPTPRPHKRIVVSVSEQRLKAYENDNLVFDWACCTGLPGRPTRVGDFQVLDKIPEAWSSVWGLRMPNWLGIYWAGGSENGIHALPIDRDGQQLWSGLLGRPASFGCIVLDTPNAAQLYDWAEIGMPVAVTP